MVTGEDSGNTKVSNSAQGNTETNTSNNNQVSTLAGRPSAGNIVIPLHTGLGESIRCTCSKYGIRTHFKGNRILKQILVKPKDKDPEEKKHGVIYCYQCSAIDCGEEYTGGTSRTLGERYREHLRGPLPIQEHSQQMGHYPGKLQHHRQGGAGLHKINQRIHLHKGK